MTLKRLDHVSVVVDDLAAAIAFFTALGMTRDGEMPIEGPWVDRVNGLDRVHVDIVMLRTPDGHGRLELTKFRHPKLVASDPAIAPPNTLGLRSVMFTVDSVDDTVARLRAHGADLVGEVAQSEGPSGSRLRSRKREGSNPLPPAAIRIAYALPLRSAGESNRSPYRPLTRLSPSDVAVIRALVNTRSLQSLAAGISVAYETISSVVSFTDEADLGLPNPVSTVNRQ